MFTDRTDAGRRLATHVRHPRGTDLVVLAPGTAGTVELAGRLALPDPLAGLVVLAAASADGRHRPGSRVLTESLHHAGLGTLVVDLLTPDEQPDRSAGFDIRRLSERLIQVLDWLSGQPEGNQTPLGLLGTGTAAAAALWAAADIDTEVVAVVSCSGRPDLAGERLTAVLAPTLLLVGGRDRISFDLNRAAQHKLRCRNRLAVIPSAGPRLEEPGTMQTAAGLAQEWFTRHLVAAAPGRRSGSLEVVLAGPPAPRIATDLRRRRSAPSG